MTGLRNPALKADVKTALFQMMRDLEEALDPEIYFRNLEFDIYPWQMFALNAVKQGHKRIHITGARQGGKTFLAAGLPSYVSKNEKALTLIYAPSEEQAGFSIEYVKDYIARDYNYPILKLDSRDHIKLPNGSFIKANTASAKTKRGRSKPRLIIFDEAALIEDELYATVTPMLTKNPDCVIIAISTPYGQNGWFYNARSNERWLRIEVRAPWDFDRELNVIPAIPEKEYQKRLLKEGIYGFYSPRHDDKQLIIDALEEHGSAWVRQEYFCEFITPDDVAYNYEHIDRAFGQRDIAPLFEEIPEIEAGITIL